jgi:hypothetical protein
VHDGSVDDSAVDRDDVRRPAFLPFAITVALTTLGLASCGLREPLPAFSADDARFGRLGHHHVFGQTDPPSKQAMCSDWSSVVARDEYAVTHVSFPESDVQTACFTPVTHDGRKVTVGPTPRGCDYPSPHARARLEALADALDRLADGASSKLFPCSLTSAQRTAAAHQNALVLRALAKNDATYPYSAIVVPGHGLAAQSETAIAASLPGQGCRDLADGDLTRLGAMPVRTARAADALNGGVAPIVIATGGAIHSRVIEAFAMMQLLQCREHIAAERILVEPCAEHTHTNLRNAGRWIDAMGGRAAYLLTDDWLQSEYLQDSSGFELLLGTPDQRSLRDWGYVMGSWRQASIGISAGFWFTPYRFWAESRDDLGSITCDDYP